MTPRAHLGLQKLVMIIGGLLGFGVANAMYDLLKVNLPLQPLWVNLAAIIGPVLVGGATGYWLLCRVPMICETCRGPVVLRRVESDRTWRMPEFQFWCESCGDVGPGGRTE